MKRVVWLTYFAVIICASSMLGQSTPVSISHVPTQGTSFASQLPSTSACTGQPGLACVVPNLYGPYGLVLPNASHAAHFNSGFQSNFSALNAAIATQLTLLPIASPASGFTYSYDPTTGVYQQLKESFGPVLTERAETIGKRKFFFGANFQRFRFNKLDGLPLHNLPAVFSHQKNTFNDQPEPWETQFISTQNSLDLKVNQFTIFGTYGITNRVDVSVAIPLLQVGFNATSQATINRTVNTEPVFVKGQFQPCCSNGPPYVHYFDDTPAAQATSLTHTFANNQSSPDIFSPQATDNLYWDPSTHHAAGLGDVVLRVKDNVYRGERFSLALLTDVRLPSGDERNFLGSGAWGVKPFAALSIQAWRFTPHVNLGYEWNGSSLLAGNILTGTKANLPPIAFFSAGTDIGIARRLTLAVDYLGQELVNAPRITSATYTPTADLVIPHPGGFETINEFSGTYNQSSAAIGAKYNVFGKLLLSGNVLIALNNGGLRDKVVPLVGLSYSF